MSTYLIAIAIGPVQDFIATARRSRDLWFGSWLLSELSKAAANAIIILHNDKTRLIFPATDDPNDLIPDSYFNVVNKILAVVDNPQASGTAAYAAVQERLKIIREAAFNRINDVNNYFGQNRDKARNQVADMVEFYWAACPFTNAGEYTQAREKAELLLNARKSTRTFNSAAAWSSNAPKSALDGQRESVINDDAFEILTAKQLRQSYGVRSGERLCGVGLLKRNGKRGVDDSFFSTSHVAALPLVERLKSHQQRNFVGNYVDELCVALHLDKESSELGRVPFQDPYEPHDVFSRSVSGQRIGYDGHLLFSERLDDLIADKSDQQRARADLNQARQSLTEFLKEALDDARPSPYYSLLLADGDNMGKAIDNLKDMGQHREFSKELSAFAKGVSQIVVKNHKGSLVYAGGDDVLAFVPLHEALQCSRELAESFKDKLKTYSFTEKGIAFQPTLSVGIVIAHHLEPLQEALTLVRGAEKAAKKVEGKEALAITLSKRSGVDTTIRGSWKGDARKPFDYRLIRFAQLHMAGDIPDGAAYELRELHLRLNCNKQKSEYNTLQTAMREEAVRILGRKQVKNRQILDELTSDIKSKKTSVEELANELIVAREFARVFEQAGMRAEELNTLLPQATATGGQA